MSRHKLLINYILIFLGDNNKLKSKFVLVVTFTFTWVMLEIPDSADGSDEGSGDENELKKT
jgi:hypothetical protein